MSQSVQNCFNLRDFFISLKEELNFLKINYSLPTNFDVGNNKDISTYLSRIGNRQTIYLERQKSKKGSLINKIDFFKNISKTLNHDNLFRRICKVNNDIELELFYKELSFLHSFFTWIEQNSNNISFLGFVNSILSTNKREGMSDESIRIENTQWRKVFDFWYDILIKPLYYSSSNILNFSSFNFELDKIKYFSTIRLSNLRLDEYFEYLKKSLFHDYDLFNEIFILNEIINIKNQVAELKNYLTEYINYKIDSFEMSQFLFHNFEQLGLQLTFIEFQDFLNGKVQKLPFPTLNCTRIELSKIILMLEKNHPNINHNNLVFQFKNELKYTLFREINHYRISREKPSKNSVINILLSKIIPTGSL